MLVCSGLFGAALLYGDGMITPAISVLSAVEGLEVATPVFEPYVVPITVVILVGAVRGPEPRHGARRRDLRAGHAALVRRARPCSASRRSCGSPACSRRSIPLHAVALLRRATAGTGFLVLGSVFLVVTGGEALYADMGHFGARPIRLAWFALVLPALLLNYFGQGALLLARPGGGRASVLPAGAGLGALSRWWCSRRWPR